MAFSVLRGEYNVDSGRRWAPSARTPGRKHNRCSSLWDVDRGLEGKDWIEEVVVGREVEEVVENAGY
jgi:hypothetical protein